MVPHRSMSGLQSTSLISFFPNHVHFKATLPTLNECIAKFSRAKMNTGSSLRFSKPTELFPELF